MGIFKGIGVSHGVAIAEAVVLDAEEFRIPRRAIQPEDLPREKKRVIDAFDAALAESRADQARAVRALGEDTAAIFDFHIGVLSHERYRQQVLETVEKRRCSGAYAVSLFMRMWRRRFLQRKDPVFAGRVSDVEDIEKRILQRLLGESREDLSRLTQPVIVVARDLAPSQTAQFDTRKILGFATDLGGLTSHTAIIARSLRIPAVVGLNTFTAEVSGGDTVIIDGTHGLAVARPDAETLTRYRKEEERLAAFEHGLTELRDVPAVTRDGAEVMMLGNIEFPHEASTCLENGAAGIGLYRTEFLYLRGPSEPSEEEHYQAYRSVTEAVGDRLLTIRTMDLGADKYAQTRSATPERNPFLGLRSIRYSLQNPEMFKVQLRAILRVSVHGNVRIMFPLITSLMELRQARMTLHDAMEDLEEANIPFKRDLPVGVMVETPGAVVQAEKLAREVDFFSIGTNDLIQYTLAVDRANERVAPLFTASHPAVLRLVRDILRVAGRHGTECSLCGEMAGDPIYTLLLLGLGLRRFSMAPADIPEVKQVIRKTTLKHAERVARKCLTFETDREVTNYLRNQTRRILPEAI